jgi:pSer/pThr/pTyr-binding forkhead associated (FHA) protein
MMHRAFSAGTDTQQMWGLLRMNCLLAPEEEKTAEPVPAKPHADAPKPTEIPKESRTAATYAQHRVDQEQIERPSRPTATDRKAEKAPSRYCLILRGGHHRIALAANGQILLGRFDPAAAANPDVDLSFDDREANIISRRHARIIGHEGFHLIEDMGSTNGTLVNGEKLRIGQKALLQPGDRVTLGNHEFLYRPIVKMGTSPGYETRAYLQAMFTGHRFPLPSRGEVIVGRTDPVVGFVPDIDLGDEGDAAQVVARRHVKISANNGRHYVEDMGSANGTKLNGTPIETGERGLLEPGDHIWLGGCVLAYDVEL